VLALLACAAAFAWSRGSVFVMCQLFPLTCEVPELSAQLARLLSCLGLIRAKAPDGGRNRLCELNENPSKPLIITLPAAEVPAAPGCFGRQCSNYEARSLKFPPHKCPFQPNRASFLVVISAAFLEDDFDVFFSISADNAREPDTFSITTRSAVFPAAIEPIWIRRPRKTAPFKFCDPVIASTGASPPALYQQLEKKEKGISRWSPKARIHPPFFCQPDRVPPAVSPPPPRQARSRSMSSCGARTGGIFLR